MASPRSSQASSGSVVRRFNIALGLLYLAGILVSAPAIYFYTQHQVYSQATTKLGMLVDMVDSIKGYVAKDLRPYFLEKRLFHTPGFSGIVATARIAMNFAEKQPTYTIRSIGDNPLNPSNLPELAEQNLLERFREDPEPPQNATAVQAMRHRLQTREGKALYATRKSTVETVFGIIKQVLGFRQFLLRGLDSVQSEWSLVCIGWNLKRMHALRG